MSLGIVVIGRNEGKRLERCLRSIKPKTPTVYVDSGSTDGSPDMARSLMVDIVQLDPALPFTAARARNAGFRHLLERHQDVHLVQFVDGDCELIDGWLESAIRFLENHHDVGVVFGQLRERHPEASVYNWLCQKEWEGPAGETKACGGIAAARVSAIRSADGFREDLVAGEEPELCVRLRASNWRIWRIDVEMAIHDASITRFWQWWRRSVRSGYAFAQGAALHRREPGKHFVWETRRSWLWGFWIPLTCVVVSLMSRPWGAIVWAIYPIQLLRQTIRNPGSLRERVTLAAFQLLSRTAEAVGQFKFIRDCMLGNTKLVIEYK